MGGFAFGRKKPNRCDSLKNLTQQCRLASFLLFNLYKEIIIICIDSYIYYIQLRNYLYYVEYWNRKTRITLNLKTVVFNLFFYSFITSIYITYMAMT